MGAAQEETTRIIPRPGRPEPAPGYAPAAEMDATRVVSRAPEQGRPASCPASQAGAPGQVLCAGRRGGEVRHPCGTLDSRRRAVRLRARPLDEEDDCEEEDPRDSIAETLIRWVPPITAIVCAGIALCGFVYSQFMM